MSEEAATPEAAPEETGPEVVYVYVRVEGDQWIYEPRDSEHGALATSEAFPTAQDAAQAGADAYPSTPEKGIEVRVGPDPAAEPSGDEPEAA